MINIRHAKKEDLPEIASLESQCFSHPWSESMLFGSMTQSGSVFLIAEENETILGYVGLLSVLDEGSITNVAVGPTFRRQGIASLLLHSLLQCALERSLAFVTLEVRASNTPAICLYEGLGFLEVGRRPNYYQDPAEDAILMTYYFESEAL